MSCLPKPRNTDQEYKKSLSPNTAVLLIDMQETFVKNMRIGRAPLIIERQIQILRHCAQVDIPVAVLEFSLKGRTISVLRKTLHTVPRVRVFKKRTDSGFENKNLKKQLEDWQVQNLILMGINAQFCVKATAQDALKNGFAISTSPDLISGQSNHAIHDDIAWYRANGSLIAV